LQDRKTRRLLRHAAVVLVGAIALAAFSPVRGPWTADGGAVSAITGPVPLGVVSFLALYACVTWMDGPAAGCYRRGPPARRLAG